MTGGLVFHQTRWDWLRCIRPDKDDEDEMCETWMARGEVMGVEETEGHDMRYQIRNNS
jgi:hypothetical protein